MVIPRYKVQERRRRTKRWRDLLVPGYKWNASKGVAERFAASMRRKFGEHWVYRVRKVN